VCSEEALVGIPVEGLGFVFRVYDSGFGFRVYSLGSSLQCAVYAQRERSPICMLRV